MEALLVVSRVRCRHAFFFVFFRWLDEGGGCRSRVVVMCTGLFTEEVERLVWGDDCQACVGVGSTLYDALRASAVGDGYRRFA